MTNPQSNSDDEGGLSEGGSGDGGTTGTPTTGNNIMEPPSSDGDTMVVSGGGLADTGGEDSAAGAGDRGLG
jgi:hypothetical protein